MLQIPTDGGPFYAETDLTALIAEPWNAISSLAIVLPGVYWAIYLRWQLRKFMFIYCCIPLLVIGGIGSTLYHAFRSSNWLLVMDVLPQILLTLAVGFYFWIKVIPQKWLSLTIIGFFLGLRFFFFEIMESEQAVNLGYFTTGTMIFLPVLMFLKNNHFRHLGDTLLSLLFLVLSLVMREVDGLFTNLLPMGTHFLWHAFSGVGAFYLARLLYKLRLEELNTVH